MNKKKNPQPSRKTNNNVAKTVNKKEDERKMLKAENEKMIAPDHIGTFSTQMAKSKCLW